MRIEILDDLGAVIRIIEADETFAEAHYPGKWRLGAVIAAAINWRISRAAFIERFLGDEWPDLDIASLDLATDGLSARRQRARLRLFMLKVSGAPVINLADQRWIDAVNAIEAAGRIAAGRAAVILTTPPTGGEAP